MAKAKRAEADEAQRFRAVLERDGSALGWTIARVPFEPAQVWPAMVRLRVCGEICGVKGEGFAFRSSLFPDPRGGFCVLVNRVMQRAAGVGMGSTAEILLRPDLEPRPAELPEELDALLDEAEGLRDFYESMTEYTRREIGKWILSASSEAGHASRAGQMAERLLATMEAERELPPIIERAFRGRPHARAGWEAMTPAQRRNELFAIFYYRTPEGRERRVERLCAAAEKRGGKTNTQRG